MKTKGLNTPMFVYHGKEKYDLLSEIIILTVNFSKSFEMIFEVTIFLEFFFT